MEEPEPEDLYAVGTVCRVKQIFRIQGDGIHMLVTGISRAYTRKYTALEPYFEADVVDIGEIEGDASVVEALRRRVQEAFTECMKMNGKLSASQRKATDQKRQGAAGAFRRGGQFRLRRAAAQSHRQKPDLRVCGYRLDAQA